MFLVVGKGRFDKEELYKQLKKWGIEDPAPLIKKAEQSGRADVGNYRIMCFK